MTMYVITRSLVNNGLREDYRNITRISVQPDVDILILTQEVGEDIRIKLSTVEVTVMRDM